MLRNTLLTHPTRGLRHRHNSIHSHPVCLPAPIVPSQFKAGAIDPSMFKVINNATCPMSNQCQGDDDQGSNDNFPPTADATEVADFAVSTFPGCPRSRVLRAGLNRYSSAESARRALLAADSVRGAVEAAGSVDALIAQAMEQMPHRAKGLRATPEQLRAVVAGAIGKEL